MVNRRSVLERARTLGFLGPGPVEGHIRHAQAMGRVVDAYLGQPVEAGLDLGSGGGVPGLVLAGTVAVAHWTLVDSMERRTAFLQDAVADLGLTGSVRVVRARAEELGRDPAWRGTQDVVVSRGFGPPAVTAECACPLLRVGGWLVVSEPPGDESSAARWPVEGLAELGLVLAAIEVADGVRFAVLRVEAPADDRYPRRVGIPGKRPLF